jgi:hypothetical protein
VATMLSERDVELAHPEAFDFAFGNLPRDKRAEFNRHLGGCRYCQGVVDEYSEIGRIIKDLPPHVEPPADLEDRTVAAMVAAPAGQRAKADRHSDPEDQAATRVYPIPEVHHPAEDETRVQPRPQLQPPAELPVWRRYRGRLAAAVAAAAAIITAAIVIPLSLGGGRTTPATATATVVIPLHATTAAKLIGDGAATGRATARQAGPSWTFDMTVHGLKVLPGNEVYECWYATSGSTRLHPLLVSGGTFVVDNSGSITVTMTTGVDPRQFRTMEITAQSPGTGALHRPVLLIGQTL